MSFLRELSFEAKIGGDNECFCWKDIPEALKKQKRLEEEYYEEEDRFEGMSETYKEVTLAFREARINSLYPDDIWRLFNLKDGVNYKFTIRVEEAKNEE